MVFIAILPWALLLLLTVPLSIVRRPRLDTFPAPAAGAAPRVSVIVPARNEAETIGICLATLLDSSYPNYEIIVVDDRSSDGTGEIARALAERTDGSLRVIDGKPLPAGWFGKPWACWQGYEAATGDVLLFTDADTRHDPELLGHAVGAMRTRGAGLVSVIGRQILETFWERIVMPQVLFMITLRYLDLDRVNRSENPRDVIANGQFILIDRATYDAIDGHRGVQAEVVEDLRLAQRVREAGRQIFIGFGERLLETRMYDSLGAIIEGWSKNLATGSRQTVDPWLRPVLPWLLAGIVLALWVLPPLVWTADFVAPVSVSAERWALGATLLSLIFWLATYLRLRIPLLHAALFPLGGLIAAGLFLRSAMRGENITWKGRDYGPATQAD